MFASLAAGSVLEKRYRDVKVPIETTTTTELPPELWIRTILSTVVEIVHPTVIAGVTFLAKPTETGPGQPWVSLNKQGVPKTIRPKVKGGVTKNTSPDYGTYFKSATTVVHSNQDLKAHNLGEDEEFKEVIWTTDPEIEKSLNPLIRCTPDRYFMKGAAKDILSEPFCTPSEGLNLDMGKTYFVTWFTKYFATAKKVRVHLAYVKEKAHEKGMRKRDEILPLGTDLAFFSSDWLDNVDGYFPLEIKEAWLKKKFNKVAIITIQPDTVDDEDFDLLSNGVVVNLRKGTAVFKKSKEQLALEDDGIGEDQNKYIVLMTMPTVVVVSACIMYFLTQFCAKDRDLSEIRRKYHKSRFHKVLGKPKLFKTSKPKAKKGSKGYTTLPQFEEHEMDEFKQS